MRRERDGAVILGVEMGRRRMDAERKGKGSRCGCPCLCVRSVVWTVEIGDVRGIDGFDRVRSAGVGFRCSDWPEMSPSGSKFFCAHAGADSGAR